MLFPPALEIIMYTTALAFKTGDGWEDKNITKLYYGDAQGRIAGLITKEQNTHKIEGEVGDQQNMLR